MKNEKIQALVLAALFTAIIVVMTFTSLGYIPLVVINATVIHIPVIVGSLFLGPKYGAFLGFVFGLTSFINNTFRAATLSAFVFSPVLAYGVVGWTGIIKSAIICFVPRILVGVVPYYVYKGIHKLLSDGRKSTRIIIELVASAAIGAAVWMFLSRLLDMEKTGNVILVAGLSVGACAAVLVLLAIFSGKRSLQQMSFAYAGLSGAMTNTLLVMGGIYFFYKEAYGIAIGVSGEAVVDVIVGIVSFNGVLEAVVAAILTIALGLVLKKIRPVYCAKSDTVQCAEERK